MKEQILVDTDVIVQYLKTGKGVLPTVYEKYEMSISAATLTELLSSKTFEDSNLEKEVMEFVDKYFKVLEISREVATKAAELVRIHDVTIATAYVAATAVEHGLPLLSENTANYKGMDAVRMLDV